MEQSRNLISHLTQICLKLSQGEYKYAGQLFELTLKNKNYPEDITELAESFGLMLVKIEGREFLLRRTIEDLKAAKSDLLLAQKNLKKENRSLMNKLAASGAGPSPIAQAPAMQNIMAQIKRISDTSISVLITGDTGTGKEVMARELHNRSSRSGQNFVSLNCSAIPESLIESELFGIEKGVASGVDKRKGKIEQAHKGTLFLDEIGDMPLSSQAKILRVLEERVVEPVGSSRQIPVDIRVIAATNRDLDKRIKEKKFRSDLYYRLNVVNLKLPPLCERKQDILPLCRKFLNRFSKRYGQPHMTFSEDAATCLENYTWPGNIRELKNEIERVVALAVTDRIEKQDLSEALQTRSCHVDHRPAAPGPGGQHRQLSLMEVEKHHIARVLESVAHNKSQAAKVLGISREGLRKKMLRIGL